MKREDSFWWSNGFTADWWRDLDQHEREAFLNTMSEDELASFFSDWRVWARDKQLEPDGDWRTWLLVCGRGFGKTRTGAETLDAWVNDSDIPLRLAIVGQGEDDIRTVMIDGDSGFLAIAKPGNVPKFYPSVGGGQLHWPSGSVGFMYSAEDPEALRGPQFHHAWVDEPMAMPAEKRERAFSNLRFGLRLGVHPRLIITTTPKPHPWMKKMLQDVANPKKKIFLTRGTTYENADNLAESFIEGVLEDYEGTRLGRQELHGELLGDVEGALWSDPVLDRQRIRCKETTDGSWPTQLLVAFAKASDRTIIAVDPNTKANGAAHAAGITVICARGRDRFILADRTAKGGPDKWSKAAVQAAIDYDADEIVAEANQGGDMVRMVLQSTMADMENMGFPIKLVHATKGKRRRAEPVAQAYERGIIWHMGIPGGEEGENNFRLLEDQMTNLHEGHDPTGEDFDRVDSLVWGLTRLGLKKSTQGITSNAGSGIRSMSEFGQNHDERSDDPGGLPWSTGWN